MYLLICFICSFALVALPIIFFEFVDTLVELGSVGQTLWNIVIVWSVYLAWLVAPIVGREIARIVFLGKNRTKGQKMPPDARNATIVTSIMATVFGYLVFICFFGYMSH